MKTAAIDIGTNTFLCLISEVKNKQVEVIADYSRTVRLGEKVHQTRMFQPQALERAEKVFIEYRGYIDQYSVDKVKAIATSASRDVKNSNELIKLANKYSIPIEIISGDQEAHYTYWGACFDLANKEDVFVIDIGGGSTEIVQNKNDIILGKSVDIGAVRITEMFFHDDPAKPNQIQEAQSYIQEELKVFKGLKAKTLVAVAGTPTTLACMQQEINYDAKKVHGFFLTYSMLVDWQNKLKLMTAEKRKLLIGLEPGRSDVIFAGIIILKEAMDILGLKEAQVSIRGARFGLALELAKEEE